MYLSNRVQKIEYEHFENNMHVEGENIDVNDGEVFKKCNDISIVFRNMKPCQETTTI